MTATRLPRIGQSTTQDADKQEDVGVRANKTEAMRLYQRGVAAARGGQKRIAAGLLTRSVQHDPNNEAAWLWLSGVIDDPHQIAFCLNSVLKLNPGSERARKGLRWLEERQLLKGEPKPAPIMQVQVGEAPVAQATQQQHHDTWWFSWRQSWTANRHVNILLLSVPLTLLAFALIINQALVMTLQQTPPAPDIAALNQPAAPAEPPIVPPAEQPIAPLPKPNRDHPAPMLNSTSTEIRESEAVAYLNMLQPIREDLQESVETYQNVMGNPGGAAIAHASAAQKLSTSVEDAHKQLTATKPPVALQEAHDAYVQGLEIELEALDALSEFYSSYKTEYANLAAVRFQDANTHFARARSQFNAHMYQIEVNGAVSAHTAR